MLRIILVWEGGVQIVLINNFQIFLARPEIFSDFL
jgi:hypothetical protein